MTRGEQAIALLEAARQRWFPGPRINPDCPCFCCVIRDFLDNPTKGAP